MDKITATAVSSWSGGKDSCLACFKAIKQGYDVQCLLSFVSGETRCGCFHGINEKLLDFQAERVGIPLVLKEVSPDMKKYEEEFKAAVNELKAKGIKSIVFGDIYLDEHKRWVDRVCSEIGVNPLEPLWSLSPLNILEEFIDLGFKAVIVSCKADLLGKEFLGRQVDRRLVGELKTRKICPCGENGEFHTLVIDGPNFKKPIELIESEAFLKDGFWKHWFLDIKKYR